jgi:hypothetical protein
VNGHARKAYGVMPERAAQEERWTTREATERDWTKHYRLAAGVYAMAEAAATTQRTGYAVAL